MANEGTENEDNLDDFVDIYDCPELTLRPELWEEIEAAGCTTLGELIEKRQVEEAEKGEEDLMDFVARVLGREI